MDNTQFAQSIKDSLQQSNPLDFNKLFSDRLYEILHSKLQTLKEGIVDDVEMAAVTKIQAAARGFGAGEGMQYDTGVMLITLRSKQAALEFEQWLEDCPEVDDYDMSIIHNEPLRGFSETDAIDMDNINDDRNFDFEFTIHLIPEIVEYETEVEVGEFGEEKECDDDDEEDDDEDKKEDDDDDDDEDDDDTVKESVEMLDEVKRKIKINSKGKKRIKMKCQKGFKWNPQTRACEKIGGSELAQMRKRIRRSIITKKSMGASFRTRVNRKTKKAMRFRKAMGL